jgi:type I restriction enzyme S subunit
MGKYKAYPDQKAAGVDWFGLVPSKWAPSRLKFESLINMGQSPNSDDCNQEGYGLPFLQGNAEFGIRSPFPKQYCEIARKTANKGSLLFSVRAPVGALNYADQEYGIGRGLCAISSKEGLTQNFLWWLIPVVRSELDSVSTGSTFEAVSVEQVENVTIYKPSISEQKTIANFLDHETAKIDTLIDKQQQLIKLLKEKRQAVISHAVTKGLNPNAPMRDSGVEWLGEVPAHWVVSRLKQSTESGSSISYGIVQPGEPLDDGVPFLQTTNMSRGTFELEDLQKTTTEIAKSYPRSTLVGGEVILGIRASIGAAFVVPDRLKGYNLSRGVARIILGSQIIAEYMVNYFGTGAVDRYWGLSKQGSTFSEVSIETVKELHVPVPPISEQELICNWIRTNVVRIDDILNRALKQTSLLQERRTALISAAVTGKIDVRDWVAPEPVGNQPSVEALV